MQMSTDLAGRRGGLQVLLIGAAFLLATLLMTAAVPDLVEAKKFKGTSGADQFKGTKKPDKMRAKGGNDRLTGKGGKDKASGGGGNDVIKGGKGKDVLKGGSGDDMLDAVDGAADKKVSGGPGTNTCRLDAADLAIATGCTKVVLPGGVGGAGGGGDGSGSGNTLTVTSATGLECGTALPLCPFQLEGTGADSLIGLVTGGGEVTLGVGVTLSIEADGSWIATGLYGCSGPGFLHVEIGTKSVDVPITCTTP